MARSSFCQVLEEAKMNPIAKTRLSGSLSKVVKDLHAGVSSMPVDFRFADPLPGRGVPRIVPALLHTVHKICTKTLGMLHHLMARFPPIGSELGAGPRRLQLAARQHAVDRTETLVKNADKAGDHIGTFLNNTRARLLISRAPDLLGDLLNWRGILLPRLVELSIFVVYTGTEPSDFYRCGLFFTTLVSWYLSLYCDSWLRTQERTPRKPVNRSNHYHLWGKELALFYASLRVPMKHLS
eukprot:TRINITY_DN4781_c0_g2_i1.p1 TRINITY_DN4781_c0_g2~~TRINITY_DN4781_c0_g2_i1.p1  ORF type:complete len:262 (+),score=22.16 TRINITY_DN4781_c0_g2_i1:70-786(+)